MRTARAILLMATVYGLGWLSGAAHLRRLEMPSAQWWRPAACDGLVILLLAGVGLALVRVCRRS